MTVALRRARTRLVWVGMDGCDFSEDELEPDGASFVFAPEQFVHGVYLVVDFQGKPLPAAMGARYRAIVHEELEREGVREATLVAPSSWDHATRTEAMFASDGIRSVKFDGIASLTDALRVLFAAAPANAVLLSGGRASPGPVDEFLDAHGGAEPGPFAYFADGSAFALHPDAVAAFWQAASSLDEGVAPLPAPLWIVSGLRVFAYVWAQRPWAVRLPEDTNAELREQLFGLQSEAVRAAQTRARVAEISAFDEPLPRSIKKLSSDLAADWWVPGWRLWEPIASRPQTPEAAFDVQDAAVRIAGSFDIWRTRAGKTFVRHWRQPPFGPSVSREEATAMLVALSDGALSPREAGTALQRYRSGAFPFEDAERATFGSGLPAAASLTALTTLFGAPRVIEWILAMRGLDVRRVVNVIHGARAGVLPHLDADELAGLCSRVSDMCQREPWTKDSFPPHAGHLLAAQLGLHEQTQHTLATHPTVYATACGQILVCGAGDRSAVMQAHRRLANRFYSGWNCHAWIAVAGLEGIPELIDRIRPERGDFERRLEPLLRLSTPILEPYMRALLGTPAGRYAQQWLKAHSNG